MNINDKLRESRSLARVTSWPTAVLCARALACVFIRRSGCNCFALSLRVSLSFVRFTNFTFLGAYAAYIIDQADRPMQCVGSRCCVTRQQQLHAAICIDGLACVLLFSSTARCIFGSTFDPFYTDNTFFVTNLITYYFHINLQYGNKPNVILRQRTKNIKNYN